MLLHQFIAILKIAASLLITTEISTSIFRKIYPNYQGSASLNLLYQKLSECNMHLYLFS